jgi:hypothetical protein
MGPGLALVRVWLFADGWRKQNDDKIIASQND